MSGRIAVDTTWTLANSPYVVTSTVQVYGTSSTPVTLTIQPGVVVKFASGQNLQIGDAANLGSLISQGTSTNHITFTRNGTSGTWGTLIFNDKTVDATAILEYTDIQYSTGITMTSASPTIRSSTIAITNPTGNGLNLTSSNPTLDTVTITHNGLHGIYLSSSSPTLTNTTLSNSNTTGDGIYGSGSPIISGCTVSIVNSANKYGIYLSTTTSSFSLTNSTVADGLDVGSFNITPTITGNTFTNADSAPLHAGANIIDPIVNNNTITGLSCAGKIEVTGEQIRQDAHWPQLPAPYVAVSGTVSVYKDASNSATLTLDPGVTVKFASSSSLQIGKRHEPGSLAAQGTAANHITLTRQGTSGTWAGITFNDKTIDETTILENVDIQYSTGVTINSASFAIRNSSITDVTGTGLSLNTSNPVLDMVTITNNGTYGINLSSSSPTITGGSLTNTNPTGQGIYGNGSPVISNYSGLDRQYHE